MGKSRLKTGIVFLQLAPPLTIILALLCFGVYLGTTHRQTVLEFERDYLGISVEFQEPQSLTIPAGGIYPASATTLPSYPPVRPRRDLTAPLQPQPVETTAIPLAPHRADQPTGAPGAGGQQAPLPSMLPGPLPALPIVPQQQPASLAKNFEYPITIHVKVLVDPEYIAGQPDWTTQIPQTISEASRIYHDNFGIDLNLIGMVRWPISIKDHSVQQVLTDLGRRPREGGDVLLGFVNRTLDSKAYSNNNSSVASKYNGAFGVVGRTVGADHVFLMGTLRGLGHLMGASEVTDVSNEGYRLGTWMSDRPGVGDQTIWIDADNRRQILERKTKPFVPE
ncbi:MAG: hypothetical protein GY847_17495 [Proteobacteria bacterium]|nr:hypothetical protein [Pseudomonadota bacterium]